jgi:hypothetical protein
VTEELTYSNYRALWRRLASGAPRPARQSVAA